MTRKMKDSGVEWIGEIPEEWEIKKIKNDFSFEKGKNASIYTNEYIGAHLGEYPVYSGQTENGGVMGKIDSFDYNIHECVFTTTVGAKVMTPRYLKGKFSLSQNCLIIKKDGVISCKYLFYSLISLFDYEKSLIPSYMQPSLRISDLKKYVICYNSEQDKITDYLDSRCGKIDKTIEKEKQIIEKLKEYNQSVITEAVTKGLNPDVPTKDSGVEWIGEIPEHWSIRRLRYLGNCQNGISKSSEYFGKGYPFVSYGDVYRNIELPKVVNGLVESTESDRKTYSVEQGDIFFTRTSETIEEIGLTCICTKTIENATFAGFLIRVRPTNKESLNIGYSKYYFSSNMHRRFFVKEMNLVTRASLSQELLKKLPVLLPPIEEQQEIADYLDKKCSAIDKLISNKEKVIEKLTIYKKSLIYECVTGKREIQ